MEFLQSIGGKITTGLVALGVLAGGISWWQMEQPSRDAAVSLVLRGGSWMLVALLMPWVLFWLIGFVARKDSNAASAILVLTLTISEAIMLGVLFGFTNHSATGWMMFGASVLLAGVYNLLACDWIAEKVV